MQLVVSIRERASLRDRTGDPWDGRTLEWIDRLAAAGLQFRRPARTSPARRPTGASSSARSPRRSCRRCRATKRSRCRVNSPTGFVVAFFAVVTGFALIWHIWWLAAVGVVGAFATFVVFAWRDHDEYRGAGRGGRAHRRAETRGARGPRRGARAWHPPGEGRDTRAADRARRAAIARPTSRRPAPKRIVTAYGFWIFLLSDFVMFSAFYSRPTRCCRTRPRAGRGRWSSST